LKLEDFLAQLWCITPAQPPTGHPGEQGEDVHGYPLSTFVRLGLSTGALRPLALSRRVCDMPWLACLLDATQASRGRGTGLLVVALFRPLRN
jgi:hypothetical protein